MKQKVKKKRKIGKIGREGGNRRIRNGGNEGEEEIREGLDLHFKTWWKTRAAALV